jgi:hypothetical protein
VWLAVVGLLGLALTLGGCETTRAIRDACLEDLCR